MKRFMLGILIVVFCGWIEAEYAGFRERICYKLSIYISNLHPVGESRTARAHTVVMRSSRELCVVRCKTYMLTFFVTLHTKTIYIYVSEHYKNRIRRAQNTNLILRRDHTQLVYLSRSSTLIYKLEAIARAASAFNCY